MRVVKKDSVVRTQHTLTIRVLGSTPTSYSLSSGASRFQVLEMAAVAIAATILRAAASRITDVKAFPNRRKNGLGSSEIRLGTRF